MHGLYPHWGLGSLPPACLSAHALGWLGLGLCMPPALACLRVRTCSFVLALVQQLGRVSTFRRGAGPRGADDCEGRGLRHQ